MDSVNALKYLKFNTDLQKKKGQRGPWMKAEPPAQYESLGP